MQNVVIVAAGRTAIGSFGGALAGLPASRLGAHVISALLARTGIRPGDVDEIALGQVLTAGTGQNPARQAAIQAGIPETVPSMTINKVCGSGLKAVHLAAQAIRCGDAEIVVAGGQENMSLAPHLLASSRTGAKMGDWTLKDSMIVDGLWDAFNDIHNGDHGGKPGDPVSDLARGAGRLRRPISATNRGGPEGRALQGRDHSGVDPAVMGTGPIPATERCLAKAGWTADQLDLIEANEAFAAQSERGCDRAGASHRGLGGPHSGYAAA